MNSSPLRKYGSELTNLQRVNIKDLKVGKFYYIRMRNKDKGPHIWGANKDFIGKINMIDNTGISFDFTYKRNADPRYGTSVWKKGEDYYNRVLILSEAFKHKNMNNNTTFYIDTKYAVSNKDDTLKKRVLRAIRRITRRRRA